MGHGPGAAAYGESRWPMAGAVVAAMVLTVLLPDDLRLAPRWVMPTIEGVLLVALIAGDPGQISRRSSALRAVSVALISVLALSTVWSTIQLIDDLIHGGPQTSSASMLLQVGGNVWACTVLVFSLLYFELDGGGAAARAERMPVSPDLAFPQQLNPPVAPPGWRPLFIDYLYLGFTSPRIASKIRDCTAIATLAHAARGITSVGLKAVALVKPR